MDDKIIDFICKRIESIEEHSEIANKETGELRDKLSQVATDVEWLMKLTYISITTALGTLATVLLNLLFGR